MHSAREQLRHYTLKINKHPLRVVGFWPYSAYMVAEHLHSSGAERPPAGMRAASLLTLREAADALRISRSSLYRLFDAGELSWVRVCGTRRVSSAEIERFISDHTERRCDAPRLPECG
jgi:excisionase family DNA binding protein